MNVVLLRWPEEAKELGRLSADGVPCLLLVAPEASPPDETSQCLVDWVRLPANDGDVRVRTAALQERARRHGSTLPELGADGALRHRGKWVGLSTAEAALVKVFVDNFGRGVSAEVLTQSWQGDGPSSGGALRIHIMRLRRVLGPLGLEIHTLRGHGYMLDAVAPAAPPADD